MKKIFILLAVFILTNTIASAQKLPVRITPGENISTAYDEIEVGDNLKFKTMQDIYYNQKLYIKKDTPVYAQVGLLSDNGWAFDHAEINFKKFVTTDVNNNTITINDDLTINGFELIKTKGKRPAQFFNYIGVIFRGKEIDIKYSQDIPVFTIWLDK